jgi:hypothetical protein
MTQEKTCGKCGETKGLDGFYKNKTGKFGVRSGCKTCHKVYQQENREAIAERKKVYRQENRETIAARNKVYQQENREALAAYHKVYQQENREALAAYRQDNREAIADRNQVYQQENREALAAYNKVYRQENRETIAARNKVRRQENPHLYNARYAKRRACKLNATPPWLTPEHLEGIKAIYLEAQTLTVKTGVLHHVDHRVPLRGKNVCGLHVPWNLKPIPASENMSKHASFDGGW